MEKPTNINTAEQKYITNPNGFHHPEQTIPLEEFLKLREELLEKQASMENRLWIDSNLGKFDDILRLNFNNTLEKFSDNIIQHICQVLRAVHGAFFIIEDNLIKAMGGYACTVETMTVSQFKIGEGIIGQAVKSKEMLMFENLETRLDSSLGRLAASCLTVCPLIFNQEVYGAIEITTLSKLQAKEEELLDRMCRNTASFLQSFISNRQTKQLLEATQQQTEELRTQEEELRQSMEELQTLQEEAIRKNIELDGFVKAINSTLATIEFDMNGKIKTANAKFLSLMGYEIDEIFGLHHSIFVGTEYAKSEEYRKFWDNLNKGLSQTNSDFKRFTKNGEVVWLSATYTPIFDSNGVPFKVLKLALDNTAAKQRFLDAKWQMEAISKSFAVIEFELDSTIRTANENFLGTIGYTLDEIRGQKHKMFVAEEYQNEAYKQLWDKLRSGEFQAGEFPRVTKDGQEIWINGSYNPIFNAEGKPYKIVKYVTDVTKQKAFKREMEQYIEFFYGNNHFLELNLKGHLLSMSDSLKQLLDIPSENFTQKTFDELLADSQSIHFQQIQKELLKNKTTKLTIIYLSQSPLRLECNFTLIEDLSGKPVKIIMLGRINH